MSELLDRWTSYELSELNVHYELEHYTSMGISLTERDGTPKTLDALKEEAIQKDLQDRAQAALKR